MDDVKDAVSHILKANHNLIIHCEHENDIDMKNLLPNYYLRRERLIAMGVSANHRSLYGILETVEVVMTHL